MADETVSMTALKYHTHAGEAHEPDDVYEVPADQVDNLVGQGMALALAGVAIGVVASYYLSQLMTSLLFAVGATDPVIFIAISLILIGVALGASFAPARRAMKVDPMVALRYE